LKTAAIASHHEAAMSICLLTDAAQMIG